MSSTTTINQNQKIEAALATLITNIKDNPDAANLTFEASSTLEKGFQAQVNARDFQFWADEPEDFGGTNRGPNPIEYVLGALAACQEIAIKTHASKLGIELESVEVKAEGDIDLHGFLNLSEERPGFKGVSYHTTIQSKEEDTGKLRKLKELVNKSCPVLDIIQNETPVRGTTHFIN